MKNEEHAQKLQAMRHSAEHVLTQAMYKLFPGIKMAMGPATEEGFYFDFDPQEHKISEADFPAIEKEMKKIIKENLPLIQEKISVKKARELFSNNEYKQEWLDEIEEKKEQATIYRTGDQFVDLCSGPHVASTKEIKAFKLLSVAGAYWRGDEKNKMLTRIYGTAFESQEALKEYLYLKEEAKKRDHRKLGKELELFVINENIGKGLPLIAPKGGIIRKAILDYEYELEEEYGFEHVSCPHIAKTEMYKKTGHWQHYNEVMYAPFGIDGEEYVLKPMNCPHHYMIYESKPRSYRDLPYKVAEPGTCYRYEKSGEVSGLLRVRALTIDDSHILMTEEQVEEEFRKCIEMVAKMFKAFQLNDYHVRLSLSDPSDAIKYIADAETWKKAGNKLEKIIKDNKLEYVKEEGEASFYGPKIDYMVKDSLGRQWQMSTLQLDLFMAKRLNLTYTDKDGTEKHPVILHRGLTGSIERTMGILIEHFGGAFPLWLAPVQSVLIPISEKHAKYAQTIAQQLRENHIRVEINDQDETMQSKIRNAQGQKIPYMIIIGDKEVEEKSISLRTREGEKQNNITLETLIQEMNEKIKEKK